MENDHHVDNDLRMNLIAFIKRKFASRPEIYDISDDIVNQAFTDLYKSKNYSIEKENFGYLSMVALRIAYKYFKQYDSQTKSTIAMDHCLEFMSDDNVVEEILRAEETAMILESLETLKRIERIIIVQRYYGDLKFADIAKKNKLNLNTVLSHHRRSLEKLRSSLTRTMSNTQKNKHQDRRYPSTFTRML